VKPLRTASLNAETSLTGSIHDQPRGLHFIASNFSGFTAYSSSETPATGARHDGLAQPSAMHALAEIADEPLLNHAPEIAIVEHREPARAVVALRVVARNGLVADAGPGRELAQHDDA
jgi:hypothetical protein